MPSFCAAWSTRVPFGTVTSLPSMVSVTWSGCCMAFLFEAGGGRREYIRLASSVFRLPPSVLHGDGIQAALEAARAGADVFFVLVAEVFERADDGTGGEFAESAQALARNVVADVEQ